MKLWGLFFLVFKDCLRTFVMFVNVDMCKIVLIAGESTDSAAISVELVKFFLGSAIIFRMHVYVWWRIRGAISGEEGEGGSPLSFFENWKNCPNDLEKCFDCVHS